MLRTCFLFLNTLVKIKLLACYSMDVECGYTAETMYATALI